MKTFAIVAFAMAVATGSAHAGSVYKWVDENGKVHYGDRPAQGTQSTRLEVETPKSTTSDISEARREKQRRLLEAFEREHAQDEAEQAERQRKKQERKIACARARVDLERIQNAGYLYHYNDQGERVVYSHSERVEATQEAQAAVRQFC